VADLAALAASFGDRLHSAGVPVTPERSARFAQAAVLAEPRTVEQLYWTGRITLVSDPGQLPTFDAVFSSVFRGLAFGGSAPAVVPSDSRSPLGAPTARDRGQHRTADRPDDDDAEVEVVAVSTVERLSARPFASCTPEELALLATLVEQLPLIPPLRRTRRSRRHAHGRRIDVRASLRRARSTGGDPVHLVHRRRMERPRRIVLLADVSGSMQTYARVYLHLLRAAVRALPAEAFVFSTRLTRLTGTLRHGAPDAAYDAVTRLAPDWAGGTRIGQALTSFVDDHGRRGMARGAVVVVLSDGWEVQDAELLGEAMRRLQRLAYHVIWVNPRSASSTYQPLVAGMAAALPYVDTFVSGHSLDALGDVLTAVGAVPARQRSPGRDLLPAAPPIS
jgi:uncharacterized protein